MCAALDPGGNIVRVGDVLLRTPGLAGVAEVLLPAKTKGPTRVPTVESTTDAFETALRSENIKRQLVVKISQASELPAPVGGTRSTAFHETAIEAQIPDPGDDWGQVVLAVDESGVSRWNFALPESGKTVSTRAGARRTYLIPRQSPPVSREPAKMRGLASAVGMKLLKVLVFRLVDPLVGRLGERSAERWEEKKRPYAIRVVTPENYREASELNVGSEEWRKLGTGRALLLVHGTFSRAHTAFGSLPVETVSELYRRYKGRIFAFDHYTMSEDPKQNVKWFFERIPDGINLDLDILCHSRGGLVSRVLAERQSEFSVGGRRMNVRKIAFVATPNSGTVLTDSKYMGDFLDAYTNLLNFFPSNGITEVLEGLLIFTKMLAVGALEGLPGLLSMLPDGDFLKALNEGPQPNCCYYAIASDYGPKDPGLRAWSMERLRNKVFRCPNDLVVPTTGVYDIKGGGHFSFAANHIFPKKMGISHSRYFSEPETQVKLLDWLRGTT